MTTQLERPAPAIKTTSLERGTFLTTDLAAIRRLFEEALGLECVRYKPRALYVRERGHRPGEPLAGQPYLVLDVREVPSIPNPQAMLNHWGVFVASQSDVDRIKAFATQTVPTLQSHLDAIKEIQTKMMSGKSSGM